MPTTAAVPSVGVIGSGAVGGFVAAKLASRGFAVHLVARSNRDALLAAGLTLTEDGRSRTVVPTSVVASVEQLAPVEAIVVATKTTDVPSVSSELARCWPSTTVLGLHNGLAPESLYVDASPERVLLGGIAYMTAQMSDATHVAIQGPHRLIICTQRATNDRAVQEASSLVDTFRSAGLETEQSADLVEARWAKTAWSLVFAGPCTILDVDTRRLVETKATRNLLSGIFAEAVAVARHDGVHLPATELADMIEDARTAPGHVVSMTLDRRLGRPTEDDAIYGAVRRRAAELGMTTPVLDTVHALLAFQKQRMPEYPQSAGD